MLIHTLPALLRGLKCLCSEDVCSLSWSVLPSWGPLRRGGNRCSQPIPFVIKAHVLLWKISRFNSRKPPRGSREQQGAIFPLLYYALRLCFFNIYSMKNIILNILG